LGNFLKNLTLDYWYKMLIPICVGLFVLSLTVPLQVIPNGALMLISIGGFLIGTGEWINHPYQEWVHPSMTRKYISYSRKTCTGGLFLAAGLAVAVVHGNLFP